MLDTWMIFSTLTGLPFLMIVDPLAGAGLWEEQIVSTLTGPVNQAEETPVKEALL